MNQELKERLVQTLPPIWPPGAPVTVTNAGVCGEIFWTMGSFRSCRKGFLQIFWCTEEEGWWWSPNLGTVGGTGLLAGEKVPPGYSCKSQSGATVHRPRIWAKVKRENGMRKKWQLPGVRCSSDSMTRGWAEKCSAAAQGSFSTLGAGWSGAQGLGSAQYARTRQTATTLPQTFARRN